MRQSSLPAEQVSVKIKQTALVPTTTTYTWGSYAHEDALYPSQDNIAHKFKRDPTPTTFLALCIAELPLLSRPRPFTDNAKLTILKQLS